VVTHRARDRVEKAEEAAALGAVIKRRQKDEHESYGWKSRDFRSGCRRFGKPHRGGGENQQNSLLNLNSSSGNGQLMLTRDRKSYQESK
jgi:hypothetical protein